MVGGSGLAQLAAGHISGSHEFLPSRHKRERRRGGGREGEKGGERSERKEGRKEREGEERGRRIWRGIKNPFWQDSNKLN